MKLKSSDNSFFGSNSTVEAETQRETTPEPTKFVAPTRVAEVTTAQKSQSIIGGNIKFRGELIGTEDIHIEGTVEGTIIMQGHNLTIGTNGVIDANIHANNITINGKLTGDVLADELISIKKSAQVKGNLIAPRIQLDDGGKFKGSMDMIDTEQDKKERNSEFKSKLIHPHLPTKDNNPKNQVESTLKSESKSTSFPSSDGKPV